MFGLESLDVLIGLVTIYLVLALACTTIVEATASWTNLRSKNLETALTEFLSGNLDSGRPAIQAFYQHPLIQALSKGVKGRPSYVPPEVVGQVVIHMLASVNPNAASLEDAINQLPGTAEDNRVKGLLMALATQTGGDGTRFQEAVAKHFDAVMDRASGWVKRRQQTVALLVSAVLVCVANVDTVAVATSLSASPELRAKLVAAAEQQLKEGPPPAPQSTETPTPPTAVDDTPATSPAAATGGAPAPDSAPSAPASTTPETPLQASEAKTEEALQSVSEAKLAIEAGGLQFGWTGTPQTLNDWVIKVMGLIISIFAVALGAPFWFDVLQRFMQVRSSGISPREKKQAETK